MCNEQKFFKCDICGNLFGLIQNAGATITCCGEPMHELEANTAGESGEKHIPTVTLQGSSVDVAIGSMLHPMTDEHGISWVYLQTEHGGQRKCLSNSPTAKFLLSDDKPVAVFAYCNLHGLWKTDL